MNSTEARALGEALRMLRHRHGLSAERLARQAGVSRETVLSIENGKFKDRPYSLPAICEALGVAPADVMDSAARIKSGIPVPEPRRDGLERRVTRYDKARARVRSADIPRSERERLLSVIDRLEVQQGALDEVLDATVDGIG